MIEKKIDFSAIDWELSPVGSRSKGFKHGTQAIRLVEINDGDEADWCRKGHIGYVIEGELEIEFRGETIEYKTGDGLVISAGESYEHRPRALTSCVKLFLVDDSD